MGNRDPRVDAYIDKAQDFAKVPLQHIRELVHKSCPNVEETIKWNMPFFMSHGKILCHMAAFKQHMVMGFWKAKELEDPNGVLEKSERTAMGHLGKIRDLKELPEDKDLIGLIQAAYRYNETL